MQIKVVLEKAIRCAAVLLSIPALGACGAETPPYDDLPLRDALSAAPEVLAALPEEALHDMAVRLEEAHGASEEATAVGGVEIASVPALVRSADAAREELGEDAIVLGALEPSAGGLVLRSLAAERAPEGPLDRPVLAPALAPVLAGQPASPETAGLEDAALDGRAGAIVAELARRAGARELVRVTGLPAGVVARDHTVYVNASWLVALSALAPPDRPAPPGPPGDVVVLPEPPRIEPRSVRGNPYHLPGSIAECAAGVRDVCTCAVAGTCDHERTDPAFADAQAECAWVNAEPLRAEALCVLALMSIDGVKECVQAAGSGTCGALPIAGRDGALAFAADAGCMAALDRCLQYGRPTTPAGVPSGSSSGSSESGCGSSSGCGCAGCNEDVAGCNQNCSDCNQNCRDCNQNCRDCDESCKENDPSTGSGSSASCRLSAGRRELGGGPPGVPLPLGAAFWLLVPAGYIVLRIRRQA
ncbi:hypothetical protein SOCE26_020510 [Sorangium cellulosum]|uniref:Secreted protein n=1 Tax=Sorangium cellulosum TaxID=56 RepID=A0A2L0EMZ3_SORCE|nr:hypothetical protein [Sorangium cellulosum]AUX40650.1 hypothetical protein SOCE26_020510 [Sorangium cellulosum]